MTQLLLASSGWILDLAFFLILLLGLALGAYKGFVVGVCKLAGKIATLVFAFVFCISFANFLETCFHMTTAIANGISSAIAGNEAYAVPIAVDTAGAEILTAMEGMDLNGVARWFIKISFAKVELIPAGTTPAMLIGSILAKWISVVIAFVLLILLLRLAILLIKTVFSTISKTVAPIRIVDQVLGAFLGLAKALFWIFVILLVCNWLPIEGLQNFIASSRVVGSIYTSSWFQSATSYAVSGQWFDDYIKKLIS